VTAPRSFRFCLYVADDSQNSLEASANLLAICNEHLAGRYTIEIVDVLSEPERAEQADVVMTPTLIRLSPTPARRMVGNLSQTEAVLQAMGIEPRSV